MSTNITIYQPNRVTYARYDFSSIQRNILYHILGSIQARLSFETRMKQNLFGEMVIEIPLKSLDKNKHYKRVFKEAEKLSEKRMRFSYKDADGKEFYVSTPCLSTIRHEYGSNMVEFTIPKETASALAYIGEGFTQYQLLIALTLRSKYAKRLYELCCRWKDKQGFTMSIAKFRELLAIENSHKQIVHLRKNILEPVQAELRKMADIYFEYTLKRSADSPTTGFDTLYFKVITTEKSTTTAAAKPNTEQDEKEVFLTKFFEKWLQDKKISPKYVYQVIASDRGVEKAYKRFGELQNEYDQGRKPAQEIAVLLRYILKNDFNIPIT